MQGVGHHHADHVDVGCLGDCLPRRFGPLEAVAASGVSRHFTVEIRNGHQAHITKEGAENRLRGPVPVCVCPSSHKVVCQDFEVGGGPEPPVALCTR